MLQSEHHNDGEQSVAGVPGEQGRDGDHADGGMQYGGIRAKLGRPIFDEDLVHRYLRREGFTIVARNYRLAAGDAEADILARDGDELAIVEVKTRESNDFGPPERAINWDKQRALRRVAREYARRTNTPEERVRFDVAAVTLGNPPRIELFRNAFGW